MADGTYPELRPPIHVLVYGSPGEGKSHFFATFPKPMVVLSFDPLGKTKPYLKRGKMGELMTGEEGQPIYPVLSRKTGNQIVQVELYADGQPKSDGTYQATAYRAFTKRFNRLFDEVRDGRWATVILDSLTGVELAARKMGQYDLMPRGTGKDWAQVTTDILEELIIRILSLNCNVGVTAHVDKDKDEVLGRMVGMPSAPGRLQRKEGLASRFAELYRTSVTVDKDTGALSMLLQTRPDQRHIATSVFLEAPNPVLPDYNALWSNWDRGGDDNV